MKRLKIAFEFLPVTLYYKKEAMIINDFKSLRVWKESHQLTLNIYKLTKQFPKSEDFNLIQQMKRSSSSIPTNIAEGCGVDRGQNFKRFLKMANGSAYELEYQLILSKDLGYINDESFDKLVTKVVIIQKMLYKLMNSVKDSNK